MRKLLIVTSLAVLAGSFSGCEKTRETLGLKREQADAFQVPERKSLTVPPRFELRPPATGEDKGPADINAPEDAEKILFNKKASADAGSEDVALLKQAGAEKRDPTVRRQLAKEQADIQPAKKGAGEDLVFWKKKKSSNPQAEDLDPYAEQERLTQEKAGKP